MKNDGEKAENLKNTQEQYTFRPCKFYPELFVTPDLFTVMYGFGYWGYRNSCLCIKHSS